MGFFRGLNGPRWPTRQILSIKAWVMVIAWRSKSSLNAVRLVVRLMIEFILIYSHACSRSLRKGRVIVLN